MLKKLLFLIVFIILLTIAGTIIVIKPWYAFLTNDLKVSVVQTITNDQSIKKIDNQTNILILGIAGGNHDGPNLSDSIIVANYNWKTNKLTTVHLPRDIWSATLKDKINSAYAYGEAKQKGGGIKLAKAEIGAVVGQTIQYAVVIDFDQFQKLIDSLGGVDVNVENSFTDYDYPIAGRENDLCNNDPEYRCRYETVTFSKGITHMDGTTALKFARSRHAVGSEGSDFARGKRQQLITEALKKKILEEIRTRNLNKFKELYLNINQLVSRDITNQELSVVAKNIYLKKQFSQKDFYLPENLFQVPDSSQYEGKWTLIPYNNDDKTIYNTVNCFFTRQLEKECLPSDLEQK